MGTLLAPDYTPTSNHRQVASQELDANPEHLPPFLYDQPGLRELFWALARLRVALWIQSITDGRFANEEEDQEMRHKFWTPIAI
ncbi:MAG: hypothetical protein ACK2UC_09935, partial [Anaerolineae bacterium]